MTFLFSEILTNTSHFPYAATATLVVGFVAAATIGSIAWYNSKRPIGWKGENRPNIVPDVER